MPVIRYHLLPQTLRPRRDSEVSPSGVIAGKFLGEHVSWPPRRGRRRPRRPARPAARRPRRGDRGERRQPRVPSGVRRRRDRQDRRPQRHRRRGQTSRPYCSAKRKPSCCTQTNLLPYLDLNACLAYVQGVNGSVPIFQLSASRDEGLDDWLAWLLAASRR